MSKDPNDVLVATESGTAEIDGVPYPFVRGVTRVSRNHPLAKTHPQWFREVEEGLTYQVEETTKAPGKKRGS